jgi:hypothetical protein
MPVDFKHICNTDCNGSAYLMLTLTSRNNLFLRNVLIFMYRHLCHVANFVECCLDILRCLAHTQEPFDVLMTLHLVQSAGSNTSDLYSAVIGLELLGVSDILSKIVCSSSVWIVG